MHLFITIYIYFNYVTLGFIYNSLYYTYISNIKARYIILPLSTIILLIYFKNTNDLIDFSYQAGSRNNSTTFVTSYKNYEDEREGISSEHPFIQSYIINEPFLNLNIPYKADINSGLKKICPDIGTYNKTSELDSIIYFQSEAVECINSYYSISIDSIRINSSFIFKTYSEIYNTFNMIIPLNNFETGTHAIHIIPPDTAITSHSYQETNYIPFYFNRK